MYVCMCLYLGNCICITNFIYFCNCLHIVYINDIMLFGTPLYYTLYTLNLYIIYLKILRLFLRTFILYIHSVCFIDISISSMLSIYFIYIYMQFAYLIHKSILYMHSSCFILTSISYRHSVSFIHTCILYMPSACFVHKSLLYMHFACFIHSSILYVRSVCFIRTYLLFMHSTFFINTSILNLHSLYLIFIFLLLTQLLDVFLEDSSLYLNIFCARKYIVYLSFVYSHCFFLVILLETCKYLTFPSIIKWKK